MVILFDISEILIDCNIDGRFGRLINGGKNFQELSGNTFFFNSSLTLVCGGDVNSAAITWQYSVNVDLSSSEVLTANYMSTQTGISWLSVDNTKQGYYQCYIDSTNSYTVGLYDTQKTTGIEILILALNSSVISQLYFITSCFRRYPLPVYSRDR